MSAPFPADPVEHLKLLWQGTTREVQGGKAGNASPEAPPLPKRTPRRS